MAAITTVPETVDLTGYAGDTLSFTVVLSDPNYTQGCTWDGHIQASRDSMAPDAVFEITPNATGGAEVILSGEETQRLVMLQSVVQTAELKPSQRAAGGTGQEYKGVYDIQVSRPGFVRTLVQGNLNIVLDVTRLP